MEETGESIILNQQHSRYVDKLEKGSFFTVLLLSFLNTTTMFSVHLSEKKDCIIKTTALLMQS